MAQRVARPSLPQRVGNAMLQLFPANVQRAVAVFQRDSSYKGAEVNRLLADWVATLMHPDDEMRWNIRRLRARARELCRNNAYARQVLTLLATNVIGPRGFKLQAQVRNNDGTLNKRINDTIELAWDEWCEAPTVDGKLTFTRLQHLLAKSWARDGELFVRQWFSFDGNRFRYALEPIDPDQIDESLNRPAGDGKNEIRLGIEVNEQGRPTAYWVWNRAERFATTGAKREQIRIPAEQIIHVFDPERVNQTRGVTMFHAVMVALKMLAGYTEAELVAARTTAAKMGFFTKQKSENGAVAGIDVDPSTNTIQMEAAPGIIDFAPDGYEFTPWDPQHPTTAFAPFVKWMLRETATGVSMSYNALANDLEGVNYSSMRSGLLIERDVFRCAQDLWIGAFLRPVYRNWINFALLSRALVLDQRDSQKFLPAKFSPRGWAWVDPLKDTQAGVMGIQAGLTSRQALLAEQGLDFEEVLEQLAMENEMAEEAGVSISGPTVVAVDNTDQQDEQPAKTDDTKSANGNGHNRIAAFGGRKNGKAR